MAGRSTTRKLLLSRSQVTSFRASEFQHLLILALAAAIEPALELAHADRVFGLGLLAADGQAGCRAECRIRESATAELRERQHGPLRRPTTRTWPIAGS